jgi:hypothetical protein
MRSVSFRIGVKETMTRIVLYIVLRQGPGVRRYAGVLRKSSIRIALDTNSRSMDNNEG